MISSRTFLCLFLVFEVVSDDDESCTLRMLLEAIAVAQTGQYLTRQGQFFVVADDLQANSIAKRYIVTNSESKIVYCSVDRLFFFSSRKCQVFNVTDYLIVLVVMRPGDCFT